MRVGANSQAGMTAPRANRRLGGSMMIWRTQVQLQEPQVPHLYRGARFARSWYRGVRVETFPCGPD